MYGWIWRTLPGPGAVKVLECLVLAVAAVAVLFLVVFPWLSPKLPFEDVTVNMGTVPSINVEAWPSASLS